MRKGLLFLVCCFGFVVGKAQWVTIPDSAFAAYLNNWFQFSPCMNGNQMDTTCPGIVSAPSMDCFELGIHSLEGIQYFDSLNSLRCWGNLLDTLPPLPPRLTALSCWGNRLVRLPILPDSLNSIDCGNNLLTSLPPLPKTLVNIGVANNLLTTLPPLPPNSNIICEYNLITSLAEFPDSLYQFAINNNPISCLPEIKTITRLYFNNTDITCVPNHGNIFFSSPPIDSIPICDSATACAPCNAHFIIYPDSTNSGVYYGFNESTGHSITSYLWYFGDGDTSTLQFPSHTYTQPGQYNVCLTVSGMNCSDTYCDSSFLVFKTEGGLMSQLQILSATGISLIPNSQSEIRISPNPATNQITINYSTPIEQINIYNTTGALIHTAQPQAVNYKLETANYPNGVYLAEIKTKDATTMHRWVKM